MMQVMLRKSFGFGTNACGHIRSWKPITEACLPTGVTAVLCPDGLLARHFDKSYATRKAKAPGYNDRVIRLYIQPNLLYRLPFAQRL